MSNQGRINYDIKDIFGLTKGIPGSYVTRVDVDVKFYDFIREEIHMIIRGGSKQGKTTLRKHAFAEKDIKNIVITCQNNWSISDVFRNILRSTGFNILQTIEQKVQNNRSTGIKISLNDPSNSIKSTLNADSTKTTESTATYREIEIDLADVDEIIRALDTAKSPKYIVLDDFHYLPVATQNDLSVALKVFFDNSEYRFILVGIWAEENKTTFFNRDLVGRIKEISTDYWSPENLKKVVEIGSEKLKITITEDFVNEIIYNCFGSVYIVQEASKILCQNHGLISTQSLTNFRYGTKNEAAKILDDLFALYDDSFSSIVLKFVELQENSKIRKNASNAYFSSILYSILFSSPQSLSVGLSFDTLSDVCKHGFLERNYNARILGDLLSEIAFVQNVAEIKPIVFDYRSNTATLSVVDKAFLFWLSRCDKKKLQKQVGLWPKVKLNQYLI